MQKIMQVAFEWKLCMHGVEQLFKHDGNWSTLNGDNAIWTFEFQSFGFWDRNSVTLGLWYDEVKFMTSHKPILLTFKNTIFLCIW